MQYETLKQECNFSEFEPFMKSFVSHLFSKLYVDNGLDLIEMLKITTCIGIQMVEYFQEGEE